MRLRALLGWALAGLAFAAAPVSAAVIPVTSLVDSLAGPDCTLRAAIVAASTDAPVGGCAAGEPDLDRIVLGPGTYQLELSGAGEDMGITGDLDVRAPLQIIGAGPDLSILQWNGTPDDRLLDVIAGGSLVLSGITLRHGSAAGQGGLIRVAGTATLHNCKLIDGQAEVGGGVAVGPLGTLTVDGCEIAGNVADGGGLAAGLRATVMIRNSRIHDNQSLTQGGGGILGSLAHLIVEDSEVADNRANDTRWGGGGLLILGGDLALQRSTLSGNSATDLAANGSGLHPRLDESGGGALSLRGARAEIENTTISGNRADQTWLGGGGILAVFSDVRIAHATLAGNESERSTPSTAAASLARWDNDRPQAELRLTHSLVTASGRQCFPVAAITGLGNRIDDASCGPQSGSLGPVTGLDPALSANGGLGRTHGLLVGSNAIDAGPSICTGAAGLPLSVDQRGVTRPQNGACDLGAIEIAPQTSATIISNATPNPSLLGAPVTVRVMVSGSVTAPTDGQVTVMASSGETCVDSTPSANGGSSVVFDCELVFATLGPRLLTASFGASSTHGDSSSAPWSHAVITTLTLGPEVLPNGSFGSPYSAMLSASGNGSSAPYGFAVSAGMLPPGLVLTPAGTLAGTPTAAGGPFEFAVTASDSSAAGVGGPFTGTQHYSITIAKADQATLTALANPASIPYSGASTVSTTGGSGTGAVNFAVTAGGGVCSVSLQSVTGTGVGTCTVTATKAGDNNYNAATATVDVDVLPAADLEISNSDGTPYAIAGSFVEYEILVANAGPLGVLGARVQDPVPGGLSSVLWTCTPVQGASCPAASGSGGIDELVDLPVNAVLRYVFSASVSAAPGQVISNTATVTVPAGTVETDASDNTDSDVNTVVTEGLFADGFEAPPPT